MIRPLLSSLTPQLLNWKYNYARTLILTNRKGGVGKSTSATHIAFGLVNILSASEVLHSWLLVDTDSQDRDTQSGSTTEASLLRTYRPEAYAR
jgi:cellulose biosynthesis protein BcsQ